MFAELTKLSLIIRIHSFIIRTFFHKNMRLKKYRKFKNILGRTCPEAEESRRTYILGAAQNYRNNSFLRCLVCRQRNIAYIVVHFHFISFLLAKAAVN